MTNELTPSEARFVRALCTSSGPLGIAPLGLSRALGVTPATVGNLALIVERKGFCTRERFGMRIFLRPTSAALAFVANAASDGLTCALNSAASVSAKKSRAPRVARRC